MLSSSFLDVAIGIVFVFLLLSLIASTVNEIILSFLNMRGRTLLEGIKTLLSDPKAEGLVQEIYNHGQVFGLFKGDFNPGKTWKDSIPLFRTVTEGLGKCTRDNLPAYIPATNFVMAFLGVLPGAAKTASDLAAKQAADARTNADKARADAKDPNDKDKQDAATKAEAAAAKAKDLADKVQKGANDVESALAAAETAQAAVKAAAASSTPSVGQTTADAAAAQLAMSFQSLKAVAEALSNNPDTMKVGKPLLAMVVTAGNDFDKLKTSIEDWYNSAMDRVSGWYKYNTQKMLFWIGLVLAIALNANTIIIVQQLSKNPTLRESIVAAAQSAVAEKKSAQGNNAGPGNNPAAGNNAAPANNATPGNNPVPGNNSAQGNTPDLGKQLKDVSDQIKEVEDLGIPLGWPARKEGESWWDRNGDGLQRPGTWIGWLFTAIAVSLGAPFWFDMLNKIMIVRSTVKPGEKSPPAKDKEKK